MQFDLLQNDLFPTDSSPVSPKSKRGAPRQSEQSGFPTDNSVLPPLPDSLLSVLSQPPEAEFHDDMEQDGGDEGLPEEDHLAGDATPGAQKSPEAFKTISEAALILDVPQHVLRFWESRFSQIRPVKSRGGRRYYRPEDMTVLATIKHLLYKQGYTIKGAKRAFSQLRKSTSSPVFITAEAVQGLSFEQAFAQLPPRSALSERQVTQLAALRKELLSLRETLKSHL